MSDLYLSLDLELEQPSQEIIQIGACVGNIQTGKILGTYSAYIPAELPLSPFIIQLTGITQEIIDEQGVSLLTAYRGLLAFYKAFPEVNYNIMTWGGGDTRELKEQVTSAYYKIIYGKVFEWPFGRRWIDIKTWFQFIQLSKGGKLQAGLAKAMTKQGLNFQGRKHNALDDAINTFRLAHKLMVDSKKGD